MFPLLIFSSIHTDDRIRWRKCCCGGNACTNLPTTNYCAATQVQGTVFEKVQHHYFSRLGHLFRLCLISLINWKGEIDVRVSLCLVFFMFCSIIQSWHDHCKLTFIMLSILHKQVKVPTRKAAGPEIAKSKRKGEAL